LSDPLATTKSSIIKQLGCEKRGDEFGAIAIEGIESYSIEKVRFEANDRRFVLATTPANSWKLAD
jgi:hypothetical protein